jgi:hypothetical protein
MQAAAASRVLGPLLAILSVTVLAHGTEWFAALHKRPRWGRRRAWTAQLSETPLSDHHTLLISRRIPTVPNRFEHLQNIGGLDVVEPAEAIGDGSAHHHSAELADSTVKDRGTTQTLRRCDPVVIEFRDRASQHTIGFIGLLVEQLQQPKLRLELLLGYLALVFQIPADQKLMAVVRSADGTVIDDISRVLEELRGYVVAKLNNGDVEEVAADRGLGRIR